MSQCFIKIDQVLKDQLEADRAANPLKWPSLKFYPMDEGWSAVAATAKECWEVRLLA